MAFQQPQQRPRPARQLSIDPTPKQITAPISPATRRTVEESQEWILFTPQTDEQSTSQTSRTPRTATHRTLSDIASLETHVRSHDNPDDSGTCLGTEIEDENAELDSLDDGLHAFHHPFQPSSANLDQSGGTVLPTHDGFGTFPSGTSLQEHLWQFERHNPHRRTSRHARRRSSVQRRLDELQEEDEISPEDERVARIEKWRLDQSRAVLDEIERETRRQRRRMSRMSNATSAMDVRRSLHEQALSRTLTRNDSVILEESEATHNEQPSESWWRRITRKVIQDLIGLDDATLSVIFGEQLVDPSPTPTEKSPIAAAALHESRVAFHDSEPAWEIKLLDRIARELGILVHQLSEYDGAAFNTYKNAQEQQLEYAGLPRNIPRQPSLRQRRREEKARLRGGPIEEAFSPTVPLSPLTPATEPADTSLWGIEEEPDNLTDDEDNDKLRKEREYWERDVDVKMIFNYLKNRFSRGTQTDNNPTAEESIGPLPASWATVGASQSAMGTSPESQRRKEIIRQQHPLVSKAAERAIERARASAATARRRESLLKRHHMETLQRKRAGSQSCASESTKRSRHSRSGSSRHYWDIGNNSVGSGSGPAMSAALGGWGEV
ncbi:hypothetical protein HII31_07832 [Pseudocercospora fuligena]|uniref:Uncharacterized protein n=1 Tax=Pseudocercospora fuligena TaxID=685502 RepID=A0A8H6RGW3_9PEZI|nr:hypothetical protein HII31_07832 [Pseudocercospora fuligena]